MADDELASLLTIKALPRKAKLLGVLALEHRPMGQRQLRRVAVQLGVTEVRRWRIGELMAQLRSEVRLGRTGWTLTPAGAAYVASLPELAREILSAAASAPPPAPPPPEAGMASVVLAAGPERRPSEPADTVTGGAASPRGDAPPVEIPPVPEAPCAAVVNVAVTPAVELVHEPAASSVAAPEPVEGTHDPRRRRRHGVDRFLAGLCAEERATAAPLLEEIAGALSDGRRSARELSWASVAPGELAAMRDAFAASFRRGEVIAGLRAVRGVLRVEAELGRLKARALASRLRALADPPPRARR